jgi:hypothetical protein
MGNEGGKELVTESCVRGLAAGSELVLGPNRIATPSALDLAFQKGIRIVRTSDGGTQAPAARETASALWSRMKSRAGTYVVVVHGGRASVTRLADTGPEAFGEE